MEFSEALVLNLFNTATLYNNSSSCRGDPNPKIIFVAIS